VNRLPLKERFARMFTRQSGDPVQDSVPKSRRGKQWLLAGAAVFVLLLLAMAFVSISMREHDVPDMQRIDAPGDMKMRSITAPGAGVSDKDIWITKSESVMQNMSNEMRKLKQQVMSMQTKEKTRRQNAAKAPSDYRLTPSPAPVTLPPQPVNAPAVIPQIGTSAATGTSITPIKQAIPLSQPPLSTPFPGQPGGQQQQAPPPDNGMLIVHLSPPVDAAKKTKRKIRAHGWRSVSRQPNS